MVSDPITPLLPALYGAGFAQAGDLLRGIADAGEDLVGMLAEDGSPRAYAGLAVREVHRCGGDRRGASQPGVRGGPEQAERRRLGMVEHLLRREHRPGRDLRLAQDAHGLVGPVPRAPL